MFLPAVELHYVEHHYYVDHQAIVTQHLDAFTLDELDGDWMLEGYFGTLYVINLPHATERLAKFKEALKQVGDPHFEIFPAIDGRKSVSETLWKKMAHNWARIDLTTEEGKETFDRQRKGETGCYLSHLGVIKKVKELYDKSRLDLARLQLEGGDLEDLRGALKRMRQSSSVLIMEDDNSFGIVSDDRRSATLKEVGKLFRQAMQELPLDWDMLYFMAMSRAPTQQVSPHLVKLGRAVLMNAYAVNHTLYDALIAHLERIYDPAVLSVAPVDGEVADLHAHYRCYAIIPSIAYQREGTSSIIGTTRETFRQIQPDYD